MYYGPKYNKTAGTWSLTLVRLVNFIIFSGKSKSWIKFFTWVAPSIVQYLHIEWSLQSWAVDRENPVLTILRWGGFRKLFASPKLGEKFPWKRSTNSKPWSGTILLTICYQVMVSFFFKEKLRNDFVWSDVVMCRLIFPGISWTSIGTG